MARDSGRAGALPPREALERPVGEVMTAPLITIARKASVRDVAETFRAHRIKRLPVLDGGNLIGVVTRADLLPLIDDLQTPPSGGKAGGGGLLEFLASMMAAPPCGAVSSALLLLLWSGPLGADGWAIRY